MISKPLLDVPLTTYIIGNVEWKDGGGSDMLPILREHCNYPTTSIKAQ